VAFVTGCSEGGISFALWALSHLCLCTTLTPPVSQLKQLLQHGHLVYVTARNLFSLAGLGHPPMRKLELDATSDEQVGDVAATVAATVVAETEHIDLLMNNAGVLAPGPIVDWTTENVKKVYNVNVFTILRVSCAILPHIAKRKSDTIVNLDTIVGE
jgi:1-acylglycerone phosphate reductase